MERTFTSQFWTKQFYVNFVFRHFLLHIYYFFFTYIVKIDIHKKCCEKRKILHIVKDFKRGIKIQFFFPFDCPYWPLVEVELYFDLGEVYKLAGRFFTTDSFWEDPLLATLTNCSK